MTKKQQATIVPEVGPAVEETPLSIAQLLEKVTVCYIGPGQAILGTRLILHNETRSATRAELARAEKFHPGQFVIQGEAVRETKDEAEPGS